MAMSAEERESGDAVRRRPWVQFFAATLLFMTPLLLLPLARASQPEAWQSLGLRGQTVLALTLASRSGQQIIYAETSTGLWRLDITEGAQGEGGAWQQIDAGLPRGALGGPALAAWRNVPGRPQQLYALTESGMARQLYRSDDAGASWQRIGPAPGQTAHPALVALPGLGGPDLITVATDSRVQRSSDGGATWAPGGPWPGEGGGAVTGGAVAGGAKRGGERVAALLGDSSDPDRLYALASDGGLWISESAGLSWRVVSPVAAAASAAAGRSRNHNGERAGDCALFRHPYLGRHRQRPGSQRRQWRHLDLVAAACRVERSRRRRLRSPRPYRGAAQRSARARDPLCCTDRRWGIPLRCLHRRR